MNRRHALVAAFAHFYAQRNRAQEGYMVGVCESFSTAFAEDVVACAGVGSDEVAHVFDYAQHGYGDGFKHP